MILLLLGSLEMKQSFLIVKMSAFVFISINMCPVNTDTIACPLGVPLTGFHCSNTIVFNYWF